MRRFATKLSTFRSNPSTFLVAALAMALCCGGAQAANLLTATPSTIALACNTLTGPGTAATIVVKPVATLTTNTIQASIGVLSGGLVVTNPPTVILSSTNQSQGIAYTVNLVPGCAGVTNGGSATIQFYVAGIADVSVKATTTLTAAITALAVAPVNVTCVKNVGPPVVYAPGPAQTAWVTSAAPGGTPFTVDSSTIPAWLTVTPTTGGLAGPTGVSLTVSPVSPCGNFLTPSSNSTSIHLKNPPAPDGLIPITLNVLASSPLIASPSAPSLTYTKASGTPGSVAVALTSAGSAAFTVDTTTLPPYLTVDATTGAVPQTLHFTTTSQADATAPGTYTAAVHVQVAGFGDLTVPFKVTINSAVPKLTVAEGTTRNITWTMGQPLPIPYITIMSNGSAIPYTIVTAGALAPIISAAFLQGFAYSSATAIPVTFNPSVFASAQPGSTLTGTVTISWGTPVSTTVSTFSITVQSAGATLVAVSPASLPTASAGQAFTVALTGTGFVSSSDPTQATTVGIVSAGALATDANIASTVINSSNLIVTITVPTAADPLLPFAGSGGTLTLGVCNPMGVACTAPTGTVKLTVIANPVIQAVTSASAFVQPTPPALLSVAPYDMLSLFGSNFCISGGTGCTGGQLLYGTPDPVTQRYPSSLSPDSSAGLQRLLTVTFQTHATPAVLIANAPLFLATNGQINLMAPSALSSYAGKSVDIVVNFGYLPAATMLSSTPFTVNVAAVDPGVFTLEADGQGDGAIQGLDWSIIGSGNPAGMRSTAADSDIVQIYATGLGAPDSTGNNAGVGPANWPADCVGAPNYLSALNLQTNGSLATLDGVLIGGSVLGLNWLPPCLSASATIPSVTIGGQPATVVYAGWVANSVAGLYQVNVRLPGSAVGSFTSATGAKISSPLTAAVQLPVVVTARGVASQAGVTIWVAPSLKVTAPTALQGSAGTAWPAANNLATASEGTAPYQYAVTAGSLPAGLTINPASGAISGTPGVAAQGGYIVTVTATDSAKTPITGSVTFTLTVN